MSAELWIRNADGDLEQILTLPSEGWTVEESAEEGNASQTQVAIPDPDLSIDPDHIIGWRRAIIYETDSEVDNEVIWSGFVSIQDIGRTGGSFVEITGRVWNVSLVDMNTLWDQRLLRGTDTKRPAETDVERMTWLVATEEMGYFSDTSLLSSASPENLDKRDTARTTCKSVADECSQQSGKNYWMGATSDGIFVWYGDDSLTDYESPLRLSNDPADWLEDELADGTSITWPLSFDASLSRDPNRVYDGAMIEYEKGAVYRKNTATSAFFTLSGRDIDVPAPEIKTKARAQRRGDRMLADLDTQNEVLTTTVRIPKGKCPMIRAGMRISVRATHLPGWEEFGWARILTCAITAVQAGAYYDLTLKLQGPTTPSGTVGGMFAFFQRNADAEELPDGWSELVRCVPGTFGGVTIAAGTAPVPGAVTVHVPTGLNFIELALAELPGLLTPDTGSAATTVDDTASTTFSVTVTASADGIILAAARIYNWDSGARTLTKPAGFVTIHERMNASGIGDRDWGAVSFGYVPVSAGSHTLTWTMSNQFNWQKRVAAIFIPTGSDTSTGRSDSDLTGTPFQDVSVTL